MLDEASFRNGPRNSNKTRQILSKAPSFSFPSLELLVFPPASLYSPLPQMLV